MAFNLQSITDDTIIRPPRMIILGVEKCGKSTFAAGADSPIFIPIKMEEGIDTLGVPKFPVANSLADVLECLSTLCNEDHNFKTVVIDSASALEPVIWETVCSEANVSSIELVGGGFGKGIGVESVYKWREIMEALDYLRDEKSMASVIIGHTKIKTFNDPERASYDQFVFDVGDKVAATLIRWADFVGFCNMNIGVKEEKVGFGKVKAKGVDLDEGTRYLFTQKTPSHPGGGRGCYGRLPSELPLEWSAFKEAVADVIAADEAAKQPQPKKKKSA